MRVSSWRRWNPVVRLTSSELKREISDMIISCLLMTGSRLTLTYSIIFVIVVIYKFMDASFFTR